MPESFFDSFVNSINRLWYGPPKNEKSKVKKEKLSTLSSQVTESLGSLPNASVEDLESVLHVKRVDLNIPENTKAHHTNKYACTKSRQVNGKRVEPELVIRRGQEFKISVEFNRPYNVENDDLKFIFKTGELGTTKAGTHGSFLLDESGKVKISSNQWSGKLTKREGNSIYVDVYISSVCAIGEWSLNVATQPKDRSKVLEYEHPDDFYILFNPWCKSDSTYIGNEENGLEEYVQNDHGCVYRGNAYHPQPKEWNFGQFEEDILDASMFIIKKCFKPRQFYQLADPIKVSRVIAQVVNSNDSDNGVLYGRWDGKYEDGDSPSDWYGSVRILKKYMETGKSVKYGQCLGIFGSDNNRNFHVWNEVWMKRPDITSPGAELGKFDGWQVIDATPQERSEGIFTCGPCPVYAIKNGFVNTPFDASFIFSEVNADEVHWEPTPDGYRRFKLRTDNVGKSISTKTATGKPYNKSALESSRCDITCNYKFDEDTDENRKAVMRAALGAKNPKQVYGGEEDIEFKLLHEADLPIGKDVDVKLTATNKSEYRRTVTLVTFRFLRQSYTGEIDPQPFKIQQITDNTELNPKQVYEFKFTLQHKDYLPRIDDDRCMSIQAYALVEATRSRPLQNSVKAHTIVFGAPTLEVKLPKSVNKGAEVEAVITFNNPLQEELTDCKAGYEGGGFEHVTRVPQPNVPALGTLKATFKMAAEMGGDFTLTFKFTSRQLQFISGSADIVVK